MLTPNRSAERDPKILDFLQENFAVKQLIDFTSAKVDGKVVEGTGSIVFDHIHLNSLRLFIASHPSWTFQRNL